MDHSFFLCSDKNILDGDYNNLNGKKEFAPVL